MDLNSYFGLGKIINTNPDLDSSRSNLDSSRSNITLKKYIPGAENIHAEEHFRDESSGYEDSRSDLENSRSDMGQSNSKVSKNKPNSRKKSTIQPSKAIHNIFRAHMSNFADSTESQDSQTRHIYLHKSGRENGHGSDYENMQEESSHMELEGAAPEDYIAWNDESNPSRPHIYDKPVRPSAYSSDNRLVNPNEFEGRLSYTRAWKPANPKNVTQSLDFMMAEEHDPANIDEYTRKMNRR